MHNIQGKYLFARDIGSQKLQKKTVPVAIKIQARIEDNRRGGENNTQLLCIIVFLKLVIYHVQYKIIIFCHPCRCLT
jgi:hypothetical protein